MDVEILNNAKELIELEKEEEQQAREAKAQALLNLPKSMKEVEQLLAKAGLDNSQYGEDGKRKKLPPYKVAEVMRKNWYFCLIGNNEDNSPIYCYDIETGLYKYSQTLLTRLVSKVEPMLNKNQRADVLDLLKSELELKQPTNDKRFIPVNNGIFDLKLKRLLDFTPKRYYTSKIATNYNDSAVAPYLDGFTIDDWLDEIACHDSDTVRLYWELMYEAINPNYTRGKMAILLGEGNNGKGTFQQLLRNLIGESNVTSLKPNEFSERFKPANLLGAVCNIGDDISNAYLDEVSNLMSVVTGDTITVEHKGKQAFDITVSLLCIFSGNNLPRARNKTQGWYRRLLIIPFDADFNGQAENRKIKQEYIKNQQLLEYVLYRVLNLEPFEHFTVPKASQKALEAYKEDNDYFYSYVVSVYIPKGYHELEQVPLPILKRWLEEYTEDIGIQKANLYGFGKKVTAILNKQTEHRYTVKNGFTSQAEKKIIDPLGFHDESLKGRPKGIHKEY